MPKLTAENEHLQKSIRNLTRDLELAESQVQQERTIRKELEESRESKSKEIEASWQAVLDEKTANWEAREKILEEKVESQERLFTEIKASYEVSQRLGQSSSDGQSAQAAASAAELEMVNSDLERTSQRLAEMEARNEQLLRDLAQATSNVPKKTNIEDDPAYTRIRSENSSLLRKLDAAKINKDSEVRKIDGQRKALERDVQSLQSETEQLRTKLLQWRDYPDLKRELEVFKVITPAATGFVIPVDIPRLLNFRPKAMTTKPPLNLILAMATAGNPVQAAQHRKRSPSSSFSLRATRSSAAKWRSSASRTKTCRKTSNPSAKPCTRQTPTSSAPNPSTQPLKTTSSPSSKKPPTRSPRPPDPSPPATPAPPPTPAPPSLRAQPPTPLAVRARRPRA